MTAQEGCLQITRPISAEKTNKSKLQNLRHLNIIRKQSKKYICIFPNEFDQNYDGNSNLHKEDLLLMKSEKNKDETHFSEILF